MNVQKQLFAERLSKISEELKDKDLPSKLEVINCVNCRAHLLTCKDPTLCQGGTQELLLWAMSLGITLPVAVIAGGTQQAECPPQLSRSQHCQKLSWLWVAI
ncbi:PREDICTED: uncharacterized protein LOC107529854 isoform X3 [Miniopterus natalensis]|uniref:uncharacterized protein LOC107529854 isoform X3 n=1 Tax=Miniopterus natalensis TaxID=291302 RepID=UPI0007A72D72|nr:PREDICTED: uncharacterized protein LOC107529854 isoform X3 [Miniopterus natalensis]